jgi:hypothetical protein
MPRVRHRFLLALAWLPCVFVLSLWIRSYWWYDTVAWLGGDGRTRHVVRSELGRLYHIDCSPRTPVGLGFTTIPARRTRPLLPEPSPADRRWLSSHVWPLPSFSWVIGVPYWLPMLVSAIPAYGFTRHYRRRRRPGLCPSCGYDLRATPGRCPECGTVPAAPPWPPA